jgi:hypothetical protein
MVFKRRFACIALLFESSLIDLFIGFDFKGFLFDICNCFLEFSSSLSVSSNISSSDVWSWFRFWDGLDNDAEGGRSARCWTSAVRLNKQSF